MCQELVNLMISRTLFATYCTFLAIPLENVCRMCYNTCGVGLFDTTIFIIGIPQKRGSIMNTSSNNVSFEDVLTCLETVVTVMNVAVSAIRKISYIVGDKIVYIESGRD